MARTLGAKNKVPQLLKDMIIQALEDTGGVAYLVRQSEENPQAFLGLVGKVLPMQVVGQDGGAITIRVVTGVPTEDDKA